MSEAKRLSGAKQPGRPAYTDADKNWFYDEIWLLEQVADKTCLRSDLKQLFENNEEVVISILTLAYFSVLTGYAYNRVARWQRIERTPYSKELTQSAITYLTQSISEEERMALFRLRYVHNEFPIQIMVPSSASWTTLRWTPLRRQSAGSYHCCSRKSRHGVYFGK